MFQYLHPTIRISLLSISFMFFFFSTMSARAQYAEDLHGVPAVTLRVREILSPGNTKTNQPIQMRVVVIKRLYSANNLPTEFILNKESRYYSDLIIPNGELYQPVAPPKVGETAIVFLRPEKKDIASVIYWRPDDTENREYTKLEIESLVRNVPLEAIFKRESQKVMDSLDYDQMCKQATDIIVGSVKSVPDIYFSSGENLVVEKWLKDSASKPVRAMPVADRPLFIRNVVLGNSQDKAIFFLKAEKSFASLRPEDLTRRFSFKSEKNSYNSLLFSYRPISGAFYAVAWTPAREQQIADIIKRTRQSSVNLKPVNAAELAQIVSQTYDRCYRIKKVTGIKGSSYVNSSLADMKLKKLDALIRRNLGPHELGILVQSELLKVYSDQGRKLECNAIKMSWNQLRDQIDRTYIGGGWCTGLHSQSARAKKPH